jgi:hypothetical protein
VSETEQFRADSIFGRMAYESRQSVFFARLLASIFGAGTVTLEHLLIAICRSDTAMATWLDLLQTNMPGEGLAHAHIASTWHDATQVGLKNTSAMQVLGQERMQRISDALKLVPSGAAPLPTSSDMPLDEAVKSALLRSSEAADALRSDEVLDVHLLLGILESKSHAAEALKNAGVTAEELRPGSAGEA